MNLVPRVSHLTAPQFLDMELMVENDSVKRKKGSTGERTFIAYFKIDDLVSLSFYYHVLNSTAPSLVF